MAYFFEENIIYNSTVSNFDIKFFNYWNSQQNLLKGQII